MFQLNTTFFLVLILSFQSFTMDFESEEKKKFCSTLNCSAEPKSDVCGIREEGKGIRLRLFKSECDLLKYGCSVKNELAFGLINKEYCIESFANNTETRQKLDLCKEIDCYKFNNTEKVCGIRPEGAGFKIKLLQNKCHLLKYNCKENFNFTETDLFICNDLTVSDFDFEKTRGSDRKVIRKIIKSNNIVVIDGLLLNFNGNINETVENFFAATHYVNIPLIEIKNKTLNENTRRNMWIKHAGPVKVFSPWIKVPQNKTKYKEDPDFEPTLSSCYHKCPKKCPDYYAPVCGVPGIAARDPSIMFQNHCYMDVAQCKMKRDNISSTSESSNYIESSFMFCLGDTMSAMYRFLPLVRTLQHMGRLRKKGYFKYKLRNMRFLNNHLLRQPNIMG